MLAPTALLSNGLQAKMGSPRECLRVWSAGGEGPGADRDRARCAALAARGWQALHLSRSHRVGALPTPHARRAGRHLPDRAGKSFNVIQAVALAELRALDEPNA